MNQNPGRKWPGLLAGLLLLLAGFSAHGQLNIGLSVMGGDPRPANPGQEFYVDFYINPLETLDLGYYYVVIQYDKNALEVLRVEKLGEHAEFYRPSLNPDPVHAQFSLADTDIQYGGKCLQYTGKRNLARVWMRARKDASLGAKTDLIIITKNTIVNDCTGTGWSYTPANGSVDISPFEKTTADLSQYLDVDADWVLGEGDVDYLSDLVNRYKYNVGNKDQVKLGGIQMDFRSHAAANVYDLGIADAVARPTRFIRSGTNGICNSTAAGDDLQEISLNQGYPYALAILPGPNNVINSAPSGDDTIYGMFITTGPDGIAQTSKAGDDIQNIPVGQGEPNTICISPGANGKIDTTPLSDDAIFQMAKPTKNILNSTYVPPGTPAQLRLVSPTAKEVYLPGQIDLPIIVRVEDQYGNPKPGIAPNFYITKGRGQFYYNGSYYSSLEAQPVDKFLNLGNAPEGSMAAVLHMLLNDDTEVDILVNEDAEKGVPNKLETYQIYHTPSTSAFPSSINISAGSTVSVGNNLKVNINVLDQKGSLISGWSRRLKLMTARDLVNGGLLALEGERGESIFFDTFDVGFKKWTVTSEPQGGVTIDPKSDGWFDPNSVLINPGVTGEMSTRFNTLAYGGQATVSFQYKYLTSSTNYGSWLEVQYYDYNQSQWVTAKRIEGQAMLQDAKQGWMWDEITITDPAPEKYDLRIKFKFYTPKSEIFYIDNVAATGFKSIFTEDLESFSAGANPYTSGHMDWSAFINTGADGLSETKVKGDDVAEIEPDLGLPNMTCILPGPDKSMDSKLGGDDQFLDNKINSGANGICESGVLGDDFELIPKGQGYPFARSINPGNNQTLESSAGKDDEKVNPIGPNPSVLVKSGTGANGSSKYLFIGRSVASVGNIAAYAVQKKLDLGDYRTAYLTFYSQSVGLSDATQPRKEFVCEVSDNEGKTWVPVWDFEGVDHAWTYHKIKLHDDPRFRLVNGLIIRWRATMDNTEANDAAYIDEIKVYGSSGEPDLQTSEIIDNGKGQYYTYVKTYQPGTYDLAAVYVPVSYNIEYKDFIVISNYVKITASSFQIDPSTVMIYPQNFSLNACERMNYLVLGKKVKTQGYTDLTSLYRLETHGPAHMVAPGQLQAECFSTGTTSNKSKLFIRAVPLVPGMEDPAGEGEAVQTGVLSGKVLTPSYTNAANAPVVLDMGSDSKIYTKSDSSGFYMLASVPTGSNYSMSAMKTGYKLITKTGVSVSAGTDTSITLKLQSGADCDGDGTADTADTDDDNEGSSDSQETSRGTNLCDPDTDHDGVSDALDEFPNDPAETVDTDHDGIGDNADTDDDGDGLSDVEENSLGSDGYITNPKNPDTDGGGLNDYQEYVQHKDPTNPADDMIADTDGDGLYNSIEQGGGACGVAWSDTNTKSNYNSTDTDGDGLGDYAELKTYRSNPSCSDTDGDAVLDNIEVAHPCSSPLDNRWLHSDTDGDGLNDGQEDLNHDGLLDTGETDPCNPDTDSDAMPDGWESANGLNPRANDAALDPDNDYLNNLSEYIAGTNPQDPDTDNGGELDGLEVAAGRDPVDNPDDDQPTVNIGTGSTTWVAPLGSLYHDERTQVIYLASELGMSGSIKSLALNITTLPGATVFNNFTIRMKHTTMSAYPGSPSWEGSAWTTVYQANLPQITSTGWYTFTFTTPFSYNGTDNLLVDFSFNNSVYTTDGKVKASQPGGNRSIYYQTDSGFGDPLTWSGTSNPSPIVRTYVPDLQLVIDPGDSDSDGLHDAWEIGIGTDPHNPDSDSDGLNDGQEVTVYFTDPLNPDTDGDYMPDGWEVSYNLNPLLASDAATDADSDGRRNLDEYLRGFDPKTAEPDCGEGVYCFADTDDNGAIGIPDYTGLGTKLQNPETTFTQVYPQNGDNLDLDGNGGLGIPDYTLMGALVTNSLGGELPGQADSVQLQTSLTPTITVGQGTTITVDLPSAPTQGARPRAGYGVIFYVTGSTGGGAGEFWGGDGASSLHPGGRYCVTGRINEDLGRASIWFLATHTGTVTVQAEVPANAGKHTKQGQLAAPVTVTIN